MPLHLLPENWKDDDHQQRLERQAARNDEVFRAAMAAKRGLGWEDIVVSERVDRATALRAVGLWPYQTA